MVSDKKDILENGEKKSKINHKKRGRGHGKIWKIKNHAKKRGERELKRRKQRQGKLKIRKLTGRLSPKKPNTFEKIEAPKNFSLINNTEDVLSYFKKVGSYLSDRTQVEFDLENIENLTQDAIALLIAKVKDPKYTRGLRIIGSNPKKNDLKKLWEDSGFLEHVSFKLIVGGRNNNLLIHKVTNNKVENEIAKQVGEIAVKHSFNSSEKFKPIYEILIECMANTNNHAGLEKEGIYNWWLLVYTDVKTKITSFSFLDLGAGIFNSLPVQNYKRKLTLKLKEGTGVDIVPNFKLELVNKLFSGKFFPSRTGKSYRGKGLPLIKTHSGNEFIKNFTIISNDVFIKLPKIECKNLKNKFNGTFLYWELHPKK